jgi:sulfide:quinone oxidoreductase
MTIVSPEPSSDQPGGTEMAHALRPALETHKIDFLPDFQINRVTATSVEMNDGLRLPYDLLMLVPPFQGASVVRDMGITDKDGYISVSNGMRVPFVSGFYAVGDCVSFGGPKMGHMAVRQGEVAAANIAAEIEGRLPQAEYEHEMKLVIDEGGLDSIFVQQGLWTDEAASVKQGRFWGWAKRVHEKYWQHQHG